MKAVRARVDIHSGHMWPPGLSLATSAEGPSGTEQVAPGWCSWGFQGCCFEGSTGFRLGKKLVIQVLHEFLLLQGSRRRWA